MQRFSPSLLTAYDEPDLSYDSILPPIDGSQFQHQQHQPQPQHQHQQYPPQNIAGFSDSSSMGPERVTPPGSSDTNKSSSAVSMELTRRQPQSQRQRLERKGHTKSRRGCYNCKRRRIKVSFSGPNSFRDIKTNNNYSAKRHNLLAGIASRRGSSASTLLSPRSFTRYY